MAPETEIMMARPERDRQKRGVLLCIDDTVPVLEVLTCVLEECGYSVIVAPNGRLGLKIFQAKQVDLVILDQEMPGMSGHEVAVEMRRVKPSVPIIMHSGYAELSQEEVRIVDAFVPKGASFRPLLSEITLRMAALQMGQDPTADDSPKP
jgi:CheY-like chemotaxis protein